MVVGVRKIMMLLFKNKLSYIFCVVGAGVTNAEWAWWFIKLNQRCWMACLLCVIFYHVFCEIWISCGYVWLRCCRIGDKCVVLFLKMWEIGVCFIISVIYLLYYSEAGTQDRLSWRSSVKNSRQEPTPSNGSLPQSMAAPPARRVLGMRTRSFNKTGFDWLIDLLQKFSATSQTLSLRHPDSATSDPLVAQCLWMGGPWAGHFEWQPFGQL